MNMLCIVPLLLSAGSVAATGPVNVERYVDRQGVEFIRNRPLTAEAGPSAVPAPSTGSAIVDLAAPRTTSVVRAGKVDGPDLAGRDPRMQISPDEQAMRDRDRAMILKEELLIESQKFEEKRKKLTVQGMRDRGGEAALTRLKDELHAHQENMRSLNAELRRTAQLTRQGSSN